MWVRASWPWHAILSHDCQLILCVRLVVGQHQQHDRGECCHSDLEGWASSLCWALMWEYLLAWAFVAHGGLSSLVAGQAPCPTLHVLPPSRCCASHPHPTSALPPRRWRLHQGRAWAPRSRQQSLWRWPWGQGGQAGRLQGVGVMRGALMTSCKHGWTTSGNHRTADVALLVHCVGAPG